LVQKQSTWIPEGGSGHRATSAEAAAQAVTHMRGLVAMEMLALVLVGAFIGA
jgi:hypothetical protein